MLTRQSLPSDGNWRASLLAPAALLVLLVPYAAAAAPQFDGTWRVTLVCEPTTNGVLGYTKTFVATVTNGRLHGSYGVKGAHDSADIDGPIAIDGTAILSVVGLTGEARGTYNHYQEGIPFTYHVSAHFAADHGEGKRLEQRPCTMNFHR